MFNSTQLLALWQNIPILIEIGKAFDTQGSFDDKALAIDNALTAAFPGNGPFEAAELKVSHVVAAVFHIKGLA